MPKTYLNKVSSKQKILLLLVLNSIFNGYLLLFRLHKTNALYGFFDWYFYQQGHPTWTFLFLPWNLFLAWIPFLISYHFNGIRNWYWGKYLVWPALFFWILFLPNAPYLITDLMHLKYRPPLPVWYDMLMLFSFAWTGLMLGFFSLIHAREFWSRYISRSTTALFIFGSLGICSLGIYIGRFQRWNSWDIINNPLALISDIFAILISPLDNLRYFGITAVMFCLLSLGYLLFMTLINYNEKE